MVRKQNRDTHSRGPRVRVEGISPTETTILAVFFRVLSKKAPNTAQQQIPGNHAEPTQCAVTTEGSRESALALMEASSFKPDVHLGVCPLSKAYILLAAAEFDVSQNRGIS